MQGLGKPLVRGAHHWLSLSLVIIVTISGPGCIPPPAANPAKKQWVLFESKEGQFKALFPDQPRHSTSSDGKEHRFSAEYRDGKRLLRASYEHNYETGSNPVQRFEEVSKLPEVGKRIIARPIKSGSHQGAEATYEMKGARVTFVVKHRIYHVGKTSYQVLSVMAKGEDASEDVERFFASFELVPR